MSISSRRVRLAKGLYCKFKHNGTAKLDVEWDPRPPRAPFHRSVWGKYKAARDSFIADIAHQIGGDVVRVDCEGVVVIHPAATDDFGQ
ncbi:hypothetical protein R0135_03350 [Congregibacter variabilis]|uniref:Uncharacterized protein n=1 Tax=Congregibacter variabilis TaxID=3081200 RepID=A0ABZ0I4T0_9GAMM|nr:hypothetical protein R0135_03350 [Congregibacter sp. IMCC43200]